MSIMVITIDGVVMTSSIIIPVSRLDGVLSHLRALWWVRDAHPVA
jgi:hypothetical protein